MNKHDYKNLAKTYSRHAIVSVVIIGMIIGVILGVAESNVTPPNPIKIVPYPVRDFQFSKDEYPESNIPVSIYHINYKKELRCMARNIYFESRDQDLQGQIAVGLVTLNRVNSTNFPDSVCEVVWQKNRSKYSGRWVAQFSWTLDGKPDSPAENEAYREALRISSALLAGGVYDFTLGADHYHADYVRPYWANKLILIAQIDGHIFYQETIKRF